LRACAAIATGKPSDAALSAKCFVLLLGLFSKAHGVFLRHREVLLGVAWELAVF